MRLAADVRLRRRRAVPVQVVAALAPAAPVELGDGRHAGSGCRRAGRPTPARAAPAAASTPRAWSRAGAARCAARARAASSPRRPGSPGRFRKMQAPSTVRVVRRFSSSPTLSFSTTFSLPFLPVPCVVVLPVLRRQLRRRTLRVRFSSSLSEKNAPWVQQPSSARPGDDAVAAAAEDARPARAQPGEVRTDQVCRRPPGRRTRSTRAGSRAGSSGHGPIRRIDTREGTHPPLRFGACGSVSSTWDRTPFTCSSSTPTAAPSRPRSSRARASCGWPSTSTNAASWPTAGADALVAAAINARKQAKDLGCDELLAFATSAVRDAGNSAEVLERVAAEAGVELDVLSGEDEARLTFLAVRRWLGWSAGNLICLDIGGGSLELGAGRDEDPAGRGVAAAGRRPPDA